MFGGGIKSDEPNKMNETELPSIDVELADTGTGTVPHPPRRKSVVAVKDAHENFSDSIMEKIETVRDVSTGEVAHKWRQGFVYGLGLSGLNPLLLATYTGALTTLYHYIKHSVAFDVTHAVCFGFGVNLGVNAWLRILIGVLKRYKHRFRTSMLSTGLRTLGGVLLMLGLSLGYSLVTAKDPGGARPVGWEQHSMPSGYNATEAAPLVLTSLTRTTSPHLTGLTFARDFVNNHDPGTGTTFKRTNSGSDADESGSETTIMWDFNKIPNQISRVFGGVAETAQHPAKATGSTAFGARLHRRRGPG